jgi:hypothetical protein
MRQPKNLGRPERMRAAIKKKVMIQSEDYDILLEPLTYEGDLESFMKFMGNLSNMIETN